MAIIQASTVLSLAEKVSLETTSCSDNVNKSTHIQCFAVCRPLVDPADRGDGGGAAPEDDGPGDRDGQSRHFHDFYLSVYLSGLMLYIQYDRLNKMFSNHCL